MKQKNIKIWGANRIQIELIILLKVKIKVDLKNRGDKRRMSYSVKWKLIYTQLISTHISNEANNNKRPSRKFRWQSKWNNNNNKLL